MENGNGHAAGECYDLVYYRAIAFGPALFPLLLGKGVLRIIRFETPNICDHYIAGTAIAWAICQILSVPMILMKLPFTALEITLTAVYLPIMIVGIWKSERPFLPFHPKLDSKCDWLFLVLMLAAFLKVLQLLTINTYIDDGDSRMVVNAIDIIRTNRMFRTNPATGFFMECGGELTRNVVSPWAVSGLYFPNNSPFSNNHDLYGAADRAYSRFSGNCPGIS